MLNKSLEFAAVHLLDSLALNLFFSAVEVLLDRDLENQYSSECRLLKH